MRRIVMLILALAVLGTLSKPAQAQESAEVISAKAQHECDLGRRAKDRDARGAHFEQGQKLAEQAIALDDQVAAGHFAFFCNVGEGLRLDGEILTSIFKLRRVMAALDRTLELDPNHLDALSSKGTLLVRLPSLLGGDEERGEAMLRRVVQEGPMSVNARLTLAKTCAARGERAEAIELAKTALKIAQARDRQDLIPEARATLAELDETPSAYLTARP